MNRLGTASVNESLEVMNALNKSQIEMLFYLKRLTQIDPELFKAQYGNDKKLIEAVLNVKETNLFSLLGGNNLNIIGSINLEMLQVLGQEDMHMSEFELICEKGRD
jgi:hypothetical protein